MNLDLTKIKASTEQRPVSARAKMQALTPRDRSEDVDAEWIQKIDEAETIEEGLAYLWACEKEIFYLYGDNIMKMLAMRLETGNFGANSALACE